MNYHQKSLSSCLLALAALLFAAFADAATAPPLGAAASFAVLGGSTVTNTGLSIVTGNLGVSPGTSVTGFPPGIVIGGAIHAGDAVALQAQGAAATAYATLIGEPCDFNVMVDLGGMTLTPGVYCFSSSAGLTGPLPLTLDAGGNANAVFVFRIGSTLTTATASSVVLANGAQAGNVFWQVGSSATLGTGTVFAGNLIALTSITLTTGARISGRAVALNGAVTMDTNVVTPLDVLAQIMDQLNRPCPEADGDEEHNDGEKQDHGGEDDGDQSHENHPVATGNWGEARGKIWHIQ